MTSATEKEGTHWCQFLTDHPDLTNTVSTISKSSPEVYLAFLSDPSSQSDCIALQQQHDQYVMFFLTRTWL